MERKLRNLDVTKTSMDKVAVNNLVVSMRRLVQNCKSRAINKLVRQIKNYRKSKGTAEKQEKLKRKADRLVEQIMLIKKLDKDKTAQFCLSCTQTVKQAEKEKDEVRAMTRVAIDSAMQEFVLKWRGEHSDWEELAAYLHERISRRLKKKARKIEETAANTGGITKESPTDAKLSSLHTESKKASHQQASKGPLEAVQNKISAPASANLSVQKTASVKGEPPISDSDDNDMDSEEVASDIDEDTCKMEAASGSKEVKTVANVNEGTDDKTETQPMTQPSSTSIKPSVKVKVKQEVTKVQSSPKAKKAEASSLAVKAAPIKNTKKVVAPKNPHLVVKELDLDEIDDGEEIRIAADGSESFLVRKPTPLETANKVKDQFFLHSEDDDDGENSASSETEYEPKGDVSQLQDDEEEAVPGARMDSMFVGNLSSSHDVPVFRQNRVDPRHLRPPKEPQYPSGRGKFSKQQGGSKYSGKPDFQSRRGGSNVKPTSQRPRPKETTFTARKAAEQPPISSEKLHPSWEASKKRKTEATIQSFAGKKISFDD